jgi:large subunit ribosomal protein L16
VWLYKGERLVPQRGREEEYESAHRATSGGESSMDRKGWIGRTGNGRTGNGISHPHFLPIPPILPRNTPMLMPKKVKYRKQQRGRMRGKAWRGSDVSFGDFGLKALEPCWLTDRQIEAARVAMTRFVAARRQDLGARVSGQADHEEAAGNAMGKGKGAPEQWVAVVRPGRVLFEMEGRDREGSARGDELAAVEAADSNQVRDPLRAGEGCYEGSRTARPRAADELGSKERELTDQCSGCASRSRWGSSSGSEQDADGAPGPGAVKTFLRHEEGVDRRDGLREFFQCRPGIQAMARRSSVSAPEVEAPAE